MKNNTVYTINKDNTILLAMPLTEENIPALVSFLDDYNFNFEFRKVQDRLYLEVKKNKNSLHFHLTRENTILALNTATKEVFTLYPEEIFEVIATKEVLEKGNLEELLNSNKVRGYDFKLDNHFWSLELKVIGKESDSCYIWDKDDLV